MIRIQPQEAIYLKVNNKVPGLGLRLDTSRLDLQYRRAYSAAALPDAYERLLLDVIRNNQTLFMRRDEVEAAWAWIDPILSAWDNLRDPPKPYTAGSWGPSAAVALVERDGRTWHEDTV